MRIYRIYLASSERNATTKPDTKDIDLQNTAMHQGRLNFAFSWGPEVSDVLMIFGPSSYEMAMAYIGSVFLIFGRHTSLGTRMDVGESISSPCILDTRSLHAKIRSCLEMMKLGEGHTRGMTRESYHHDELSLIHRSPQQRRVHDVALANGKENNVVLVHPEPNQRST